MIKVHYARSAADYANAANLMRDFVAWHGERHVGDEQFISSYFDHASFERELAELDKSFGPPDGPLLLAASKGNVVGCVGLKRIDEQTSEMKRMFVRPDARGLGIGKLLANAICGEAKALAYRYIVLDTGPKQTEAQSLYRSLGFREIDPYYEMSAALRDWLTFMRLDLAPLDGDGANVAFNSVDP